MRLWRNGNPWTLLVGIQIRIAIMISCMEVLQKSKNRVTIWSSNPTTVYISKENEISITNRYLHFHIHSCIFHSSQKNKQTKRNGNISMTMNKWMDQENMVYIYTREYYTTLKKKKKTLSFVTTRMYLEDHYAEGNKAGTER